MKCSFSKMMRELNELEEAKSSGIKSGKVPSGSDLVMDKKGLKSEVTLVERERRFWTNMPICRQDPAVNPTNFGIAFPRALSGDADRAMIFLTRSCPGNANTASGSRAVLLFSATQAELFYGVRANGRN